jgi:hypothetical protein
MKRPKMKYNPKNKINTPIAMNIIDSVMKRKNPISEAIPPHMRLKGIILKSARARIFGFGWPVCLSASPKIYNEKYHYPSRQRTMHYTRCQFPGRGGYNAQENPL